MSKYFGGHCGKYRGKTKSDKLGISDDYGTNAVMYDLDKLATNPPKILVYLPGTGSKKFGAIKFLESAMSSGYLVVGLGILIKLRWGYTAVREVWISSVTGTSS